MKAVGCLSKNATKDAPKIGTRFRLHSFLLENFLHFQPNAVFALRKINSHPGLETEVGSHEVA